MKNERRADEISLLPCVKGKDDNGLQGSRSCKVSSMSKSASGAEFDTDAKKRRMTPFQSPCYPRKKKGVGGK